MPALDCFQPSCLAAGTERLAVSLLIANASLHIGIELLQILQIIKQAYTNSLQLYSRKS